MWSKGLRLLVFVTGISCMACLAGGQASAKEVNLLPKLSRAEAAHRDSDGHAVLAMPKLVQASQAVEPTHDRTSITGVRVTEGNAVDCPRIRDDDGVIHTVSYLSPGVAIGGRVAVRGFYAVTTRCLGTVLVVEEERIPKN